MIKACGAANRTRLEPHKIMINNISSCGGHATDIASLRQNRTTKTQDATNTGKTGGDHRNNPQIPPGLGRAAERIASKMFARADADGSGTVTQEELSAVHSRQARALASSDLFQSSTTPEGAADTTTQAGVTEAQLKDALTTFFYAKVGATYTPSITPSTVQPDVASDKSASGSVLQAMA
jgi:hypothetical protein